MPRNGYVCLEYLKCCTKHFSLFICCEKHILDHIKADACTDFVLLVLFRNYYICYNC